MIDDIFEGIGSIFSGIFGGSKKASAEDRAIALKEKGIQEWLDLVIPDPEEQKLALKEFVLTGTLTPAFEKAIKQNPSAFEKVVQDADLRQSRLRSLRSLESIGTGEGTFEDKAAQAKAGIDSAAQARGNQKAIMGNLASRGQLGSGLELAARMDQAQADADAAANTSLNLEAQRKANALRAIQGAGDLAGDIADDDYKVASDAARAKDTISAFNTQNLRDVNAANTRAVNDARRFNLENSQDVSNRNTAQSNFEQQYNKELKQKEFENKAKRAAGVADQYGGAASQASEMGKSAAEYWGNIAGTIPKVFSAASAKKKKKDDEL